MVLKTEHLNLQAIGRSQLKKHIQPKASGHLIPGDSTIRAVKPGDTRKRLNDGGGLYLRLFVNGGAHGWRFDYTFEGRLSAPTEF